MVNIVGSRKKNDCVICALATFYRVDYDEVYAKALAINAFSPIGGIYTHKIGELIASLGFKVERVDGSRIHNGIFRYTRGPRNKVGHCVAVVDGKAYDNNGVIWALSSRRLSNMGAWLPR